MNRLKIVCLILWVGLSIKTKGQQIDVFKFEQLFNKDYLPYKNEQGGYLGCGYSYECMTMTIVFYEIRLDKHKKILSLKGRAIEQRDIQDSSGAYGAVIFLARPHGEQMTQVRGLGRTFIENKKSGLKSGFPSRHGDFSIRFRFEAGDRLYFEHPLFQPVEYNISKLF